ncbi:MAG TPA: hypothetical protein VK205_11815 [Prolixibacteraceae bacterium]|nr:hypothetical protein [Prolixibacteraceae bacterium]
MKHQSTLSYLTCIFLFGLVILMQPGFTSAQISVKETVISEKLLYHPIHLNAQDQSILPWYSTDLGKSYDYVIGRVWNFWDTMRKDKNGLPYYMNHQVWRDDFNDRRGIGGDQFAMALSSWNLLYAYSGNEMVKEEMKFIADYYLTHSLSPAEAAWPNIPYPYNTLIYSGIYDGDMVIGKDFTQPDKAGSFGFELVKLYKMTTTSLYPNITDKRYLDAAVNIANTLAQHLKEGDENNSPLPFKVNAVTGEIGQLKSNSGSGEAEQLSSYTSNWSGTMELFINLIELKAGDTANYQKSLDMLLRWMKTYPLKTNKWGPFFEDVPGWSDTQINAVTFAQFMMNHPKYFPNWKEEVKGIFNWVYTTLGNKEWKKYGVTVVNEQTAYRVPGNSHSSRQASADLQYAALSGDRSMVQNAVRQLNWATYMVDNDGKNCYPRDEVWMTDGYGDYIRHFLRAMAFDPELAPSDQTHLLSSTSIIQHMEYAPSINKFYGGNVPKEKVNSTLIHYRTFDANSMEVIRITTKPESVFVNNTSIPETDSSTKEGWSWKTLNKGGLLTVRHTSGNEIAVFGK